MCFYSCLLLEHDLFNQSLKANVSSAVCGRPAAGERQWGSIGRHREGGGAMSTRTLTGGSQLLSPNQNHSFHNPCRCPRSEKHAACRYTQKKLEEAWVEWVRWGENYEKNNSKSWVERGNHVHWMSSQKGKRTLIYSKPHARPTQVQEQREDLAGNGMKTPSHPVALGCLSLTEGRVHVQDRRRLPTRYRPARKLVLLLVIFFSCCWGDKIM